MSFNAPTIILYVSAAANLNADTHICELFIAPFSCIFTKLLAKVGVVSVIDLYARLNTFTMYQLIAPIANPIGPKRSSIPRTPRAVIPCRAIHILPHASPAHTVNLAIPILRPAMPTRALTKLTPRAAIFQPNLARPFSITLPKSIRSPAHSRATLMITPWIGLGIARQRLIIRRIKCTVPITTSPTVLIAAATLSGPFLLCVVHLRSAPPILEICCHSALATGAALLKNL